MTQLLEPFHMFFFQTLLGQSILAYVIMFVVPIFIPMILIFVIGINGLRHLFSYEPRISPIHRLDPRIKILYPFIIGTLSVLLNWNYVYFLLIFTIIPWILVRPSFNRARVVLTMMLIPALGLIWSQGMFYVLNTPGVQSHWLFVFPPTISWLGVPGLSTEGLLNGTQQAGRVMVAGSATLILLLSTKSSEIIWAFYKFRMPAPVGLAFSVALRFLPQMIERMTVLLQVIQVRGYDLSVPRWWQIHIWPSYLGRVITAIPLVTVPLLIGSLRSTSTTAMVVDARGFGAKPQRTSLQNHALTRDDAISIAVLASLVIVSFLLIFLHIANRVA